MLGRNTILVKFLMVLNGSVGSPTVVGKMITTQHANMLNIVRGKYIKYHLAMQALHNNYDPS
jgi:hypothetical protein